MKLLWVKTDFLHPTNRGGQIRTLEMLKRLHERHWVDYATLAMEGLSESEKEEGLRRASEYCRRHFSVPHRASSPGSLGFGTDLIQGVLRKTPVAVFRWQNRALMELVRDLDAKERYDAVVCDFLAAAASMPDWGRMTLFQHNVEAQIWRRHAEQARNPLKRWYMEQQASKMAVYERTVCRAAKQVIAVSDEDAKLMETSYGLRSVLAVKTGVDWEYFQRNDAAGQLRNGSELVFVGSMDWLPNIDGAKWLATEIMPRIWAKRPETKIALVGRKPVPAVKALAEEDSRICVTGTVEDVRPWLNAATLSVVPLRIGGGTRLKIFEAMAAGLPVVSTRVGAEGLGLGHGETLLYGDSTDEFASACLQLLDDKGLREQLSANALNFVRCEVSWDAVARQFESFLMARAGT